MDVQLRPHGLTGNDLQVTRRVLAALAIAGLALAGLPATDAAPTPTAVVDDDGLASAGNCNANVTAHSTVAAAVAAADDNWIVKICPGNYSLGGGVTLPANKPGIVVRGPRLVDGKSRRLPSATEAVITSGRFFVQATGVRIEGLAFTDTGGISVTSPSDTVQVRNNLFWRFYSDALVLNGVGAGANVVERNRFVGRPDNGSSYAITAVGSDRLTVARNTLDNLHVAGIVMLGQNDNLTVEHNQGTNVAAFIWVEGGANIAIRANTLLRRPDPAAPTLLVHPGIRVATGTPLSNVVIERNFIRQATEDGILLYAGGVGATGVVVRHNTIERSARDGIDIIGAQPGAVTVFRNTVRNAGRDGVRVDDSASDVTLERNQIVRSTGYDCLDESDPTDNTWTANRGANAQPDTICV